MEIKEDVQITLQPKDVEDILKNYFSEKYQIDNIYFVVGGVENKFDFRAEFPLSYELTKVKLVGKTRNNDNKPRRTSQVY